MQDFWVTRGTTIMISGSENSCQ